MAVTAIKGKTLLGDNFFEQVGGYTCLRRVHDILYSKMFVHPWLKGFFAHTKRSHVESQQTDFWAGLMGRPEIYGGRRPTIFPSRQDGILADNPNPLRLPAPPTADY